MASLPTEESPIENISCFPGKESPQSCSQKSIFDYHMMQRRMMNDEELLREIIQIYLDDTPAKLEQIKNCLDINDLPAVAREAHSLKGASLNVEAKAVAELAQKLQNTAEALNLLSTQQILQEIEQEMQTYHKVVTELLFN